MRLRRESYINLLDLTSFVLVTPDLVGKERLDKLREVVPDLLDKAREYLNSRPISADDRYVSGQVLEVLLGGLTGATVLVLFEEHLPRNSHNIYRLALALSTSALFLGIVELWKAAAGTPLSELMLLTGAMLFGGTRVLAIYFAQREAHGTVSHKLQDGTFRDEERATAITAKLGTKPNIVKEEVANLILKLNSSLQMFSSGGTFTRVASLFVGTIIYITLADYIWIQLHDRLGRPVIDVSVAILGVIGLILLIRRFGFRLWILSIGFISALALTVYSLGTHSMFLSVLGAAIATWCWSLLRRFEARLKATPNSAAMAMADPGDNKGDSSDTKSTEPP